MQLLVKTHPLACAMRGFLGRLPLSLALLYEAHPAAIKVVRDAYPDAFLPVWKSKFYGASGAESLCRPPRIDATPARWRAPTPSTRRQLDGVVVWSFTARFSQHGRVLEKGLTG